VLGGGGFRAFDGDDRSFVEFDFYIVRHFDCDGGIADIGDHAVDARGGDNLVAGFDARDQGGVVFLFFLLGADEEKIEDDEDKDERKELHEGVALGCGFRCGLRQEERKKDRLHGIFRAVTLPVVEKKAI